jgi:hypothetical protein
MGMTIVSSFNPDTPAFWEYIVPHISTFATRINWAQIETSEGVYNWSALDAMNAPFTSIGKNVAIIVTLAGSSGLSPTPGPNTATPAYVVSGTPSIACPAYPQPLPITVSPFFVAREEAFIQALITHLEASNYANNVLYVRVGPFQGDLSCPPCYLNNPSAWGGIPGVQAYLTNLAAFVKSLNSSIQICYNVSNCISNAITYGTGQIFANAGLGIGNDSASGGDTQGQSSGDWVSLFAAYPDVYHFLQLQNPDTITDPLVILPFARANGCDAFEIPESYIEIAYNPANIYYAQSHLEAQQALSGILFQFYMTASNGDGTSLPSNIVTLLPQS